jgi:hypothetical protein
METSTPEWEGGARFLAALEAALGNVTPANLTTETFENGAVCRSADTRSDWGECHFSLTGFPAGGLSFPAGGLSFPAGARDGVFIKTRAADGREAGLQVGPSGTAVHWNELGPGASGSQEKMLEGIEAWALTVDARLRTS